MAPGACAAFSEAVQAPEGGAAALERQGALAAGPQGSEDVLHDASVGAVGVFIHGAERVCCLYIEIGYVQGVCLYELSSGFYLVSHEHGEGAVGHFRVVYIDSQQGSSAGVHGGLPELL